MNGFHSQMDGQQQSGLLRHKYFELLYTHKWYYGSDQEDFDQQIVELFKN